MSIHLRQQILNAMTTLATGLATTGAHCLQEPSNPLEETELPGITLNEGPEQTTNRSIGYPRLQLRTLEVVVRVFVQQASNYQSVRNQACLEAEQAFANAMALGGALAALAKS